MTGLELEPVGREVVNPVTGELLDLVRVDSERLASVVVDLQDHRDLLKDFEQELSDVLVARLDAEATWTVRVGDPTGDRQYEITAPSPTAGTESYPADVLEEKLQTLIAAETITPAAASKACKRQLVLTLDAPWTADLQDLVQAVKDPEAVIQIAGVRVDVVKADASVKAVAGGIAALRKVPGTVEALDDAKVYQPTPPRKARVTVKGRGA